MEVVAKKSNYKLQTLEEHTQWVVEEALNQIDLPILHKVSTCTGWSEQKILDLIFFSAYFHDIGKATVEFQETIQGGKKSYHAMYSASALAHITDFEFLENDTYINLLLVNVLTHHSLMPYTPNSFDFSFLKSAQDFFLQYKILYKNFFQQECYYNFDFQIIDNIKLEVEAIEDDLKGIKQNDKLRVLYTYVSGILNLADWLASARFTETKPTTNFLTFPTKENFVTHLTFDKLRPFQDKLSDFTHSVLVEIPTGEGKTEGSLLWAIRNLQGQNTKIIYTLPTQTTSNKLYDRIQNFFDKQECGLIHSTAKIFLEKAYEKENGIVDDVFQSDFLISKSFNKPITVSTIDSLLKYFINIGRFNIATKNFLNSVIIIDEVHAYDFKLMGFLKRFLELCQEYDVKVCLMSASIPNQLKKLLGMDHYPFVTQKELFAKKANEITKKEIFLEDDLDSMIQKFHKGKNVLIIRNTVKSAFQIYNELKNLGIKSDDLILYHSTFKKRDRATKENLIFEKLGSKKPFILIATQIVEISLDIDFDVMFTDNAPIDALIQRFGRVNRKKSIERKGEIFIYQNKSPKPYTNEALLGLTFRTIQNGYHELGQYVKWLNIVYDKLFEDDIQLKNIKTRLFDPAYLKYDATMKQLHGIEKSSDNYDLRDIEQPKNDYLLYDDYMNEEIKAKDYFEYSISLPLYYEGQNKENIHPIDDENLYYKVLKFDYSFNEGITLNVDNQGMKELGA